MTKIVIKASDFNAESSVFPGGRHAGILQLSNRDAIQAECGGDVDFDDREGTLAVDEEYVESLKECLGALSNYPLLDDEDYFERELALKAQAIAELPIGHWLDKIQGHGDHVDAFDDMPKHVHEHQQVGIVNRLHALTQAGTDDGPSAIVSDLLVRFEENMSEYNDGWNGSQINYSEDQLFGYFEEAVELVGFERARTILGFYDADPDTSLHDAADVVVATFERLYGPASIDISDSPDVEKMRAAIKALRDVL